jgi:hypothetical protein
MTDIAPARAALLARLLEGEGAAAPSPRRAAFANAGLTGPLKMLIEKIATAAHGVSDADMAAAKADGFSEDALFELVICGAVGEAVRQDGAARAALAAAAGKG